MEARDLSNLLYEPELLFLQLSNPNLTHRDVLRFCRTSKHARKICQSPRFKDMISGKKPVVQIKKSRVEIEISDEEIGYGPSPFLRSGEVPQSQIEAEKREIQAEMEEKADFYEFSIEIYSTVADKTMVNRFNVFVEVPKPVGVMRLLDDFRIREDRPSGRVLFPDYEYPSSDSDYPGFPYIYASLSMPKMLSENVLGQMELMIEQNEEIVIITANGDVQIPTLWRQSHPMYRVEEIIAI